MQVQSCLEHIDMYVLNSLKAVTARGSPDDGTENSGCSEMFAELYRQIHLYDTRCLGRNSSFTALQGRVKVAATCQVFRAVKYVPM